MKMAAITRFQAGQLRELLDASGWTQAELSTRSGVSQHKISYILNLRRRMLPCDIECLNRAFNKEGIPADLVDEWPEGWEGLPADKRKVVEIQEVEIDHQIGYKEMKQIEAPEEGRREQLAKHLEELTCHLQPEELELLWLRDAEAWTFNKLGKHFGFCSARAQNKYLHVLRKVRKAMSKSGQLKSQVRAENRMERTAKNHKLFRYPDEPPLPSEVDKEMSEHSWIRTPGAILCERCRKVFKSSDPFYEAICLRLAMEERATAEEEQATVEEEIADGWIPMEIRHPLDPPIEDD